MMTTAQWHGVFVADLASERTQLCKAQMMSIGRSAPADKARLPCNKSEMLLIPDPAGLGEGQHAFVDRGPLWARSCEISTFSLRPGSDRRIAVLIAVTGGVIPKIGWC